jgi:hypothetical protein
VQAGTRTEPEPRTLVFCQTMNGLLPKTGVATTTDIRKLNGRVVLVKSNRDRRNPPTGMRGWIEVHEKSGAVPEVSVAVEFPQMFTTPAHHRTIRLDEAAVYRLLASDPNSTFEFTIDDELV